MILQKLADEKRVLALEVTKLWKQLAEQRQVNENLEKDRANAIHKFVFYYIDILSFVLLDLTCVLHIMKPRRKLPNFNNFWPTLSGSEMKPVKRLTMLEMRPELCRRLWSA